MDIPNPEQDEPKHRRELAERPMSGAIRQLNGVTSSLHRDMRDTADTIGRLLVDAFHLISSSLGSIRNWRDHRLVSDHGFHWNGRPRSREPRRHPPLDLEFGAMVGI